MISCPYCGSLRVTLVYFCPKCGSGKLTKEPAYLHKECGFVGGKTEYRRRGNILICPNCRKYVREPITVGELYKCEACGTVFGIPAIILRCLKCGSEFTYELLKELPAKFRDEIILFLQSKGYSILSPGKLRTKSEILVEYDIVASKGDKRVAFILLQSRSFISADMLLHQIGKIIESPFDVIVVASPKLSIEARRLSANMGINILEVKSPKEIAKALDAIL